MESKEGPHMVFISRGARHPRLGKTRKKRLLPKRCIGMLVWSETALDHRHTVGSKSNETDKLLHDMTSMSSKMTNPFVPWTLTSGEPIAATLNRNQPRNIPPRGRNHRRWDFWFCRQFRLLPTSSVLTFSTAADCWEWVSTRNKSSHVPKKGGYASKAVDCDP